MPQFFSGQTRHFVLQVGLIDVAKHQLEGRARSLLLAVAMINQHHVLVLQRNVDPRRRCHTAKEFIQFREHEVLVFMKEMKAANRMKPFARRALYEPGNQRPALLDMDQWLS